MFKLNELLENRRELKAKGNELWEKAMKDTDGMEAEQKEAYMAPVLEADAQIMRDLKGLDKQIEAAARYQEDERQEITKAADADNRSRKNTVDFKSLGQLMQAIAITQNPLLAADFNSAYRDELKQKLSLYQAAATGMSTSVPTDGGFLMRTDWTGEFLTRAREQSQLLSLCRRIGIGGDFDSLEYPYIDETSRVDGSRWGGVQVFWVGEAGSITAQKPKIGRGEARLEELMGLAYATQRLLRDATALEGVLRSSFESEFAFKVDDSVMRGNGAGQMLGILNSLALISVTRDADDLITVTNMTARMPSRLKNGAVWLHHADWMPKLIRLKIGDTPVFIPPGGLPNAPGGMLLGKPLIELEQCSAVGTAGDLLFVNPQEYVYIEKENEGVRYDQSMHIAFLTNEMAFRWVYRINGQPIVRTAITPAQGSNTLSPFVTVAA